MLEVQSRKQIMTLQHQTLRKNNTSDYKTLASEVLQTSIKKKELVDKSSISNLSQNLLLHLIIVLLH